MREWMKYWFTPVSSPVRSWFSASISFASPFIASPGLPRPARLCRTSRLGQRTGGRGPLARPRPPACARRMTSPPLVASADDRAHRRIDPRDVVERHLDQLRVGSRQVGVGDRAARLRRAEHLLDVAGPDRDQERSRGAAEEADQEVEPALDRVADAVDPAEAALARDVRGREAGIPV